MATKATPPKYPPEKQGVTDSKKAIFLIIGMIQLNVFLGCRIFAPSVEIGDFVNALVLLLSVYFGAQGGVDAMKSFAAKKK